MAGRLRAAGIRAVAVPADLLRADERSALVRRVEDALGPIDLLVNDAGIESEGTFADQPLETITETIALNLTAPLQIAGWR